MFFLWEQDSNSKGLVNPHLAYVPRVSVLLSQRRHRPLSKAGKSNERGHDSDSDVDGEL